MGDRFLVAVDFSRLTVPTIERAVKLASAGAHRIDLFHVVVGPVASHSLGHPAAQEMLRELNKGETEGARRQLKELMDKHVPASLQGDIVLGDGPPAEAINKRAKHDDLYEMVIVSTHGRTGLQHILLGSVAERVVRYAKIPVLVVR